MPLTYVASLTLLYSLPGLQACAPGWLVGRRYGPWRGLLAGAGASLCALGLHVLLLAWPIGMLDAGHLFRDPVLAGGVELGWRLMGFAWAPLGPLCGLAGGWGGGWTGRRRSPAAAPP